MVSVLMSFSIYWLYLILEGKKTEEVRKHIPLAKYWNKKIIMYANKSKRELMRIPAPHREKYRKLMGKVVAEFTCDYIRKGKADNLSQAYCHNEPDKTRISDQDLVLYATTGKSVYFLHVSDLKIYDRPKELGEFKRPCQKPINENVGDCFNCNRFEQDYSCNDKITRPPQSWCYVEVSE